MAQVISLLYAQARREASTVLRWEARDLGLPDLKLVEKPGGNGQQKLILLEWPTPSLLKRFEIWREREWLAVHEVPEPDAVWDDAAQIELCRCMNEAIRVVRDSIRWCGTGQTARRTGDAMQS